MKKKIGICIDCEKEKYIYSKKRCKDCYWINNRKENAEKNKEKLLAKSQKKKALGIFFASQLLEVSKNCEECGTDLTYWIKSKFWRAIIAHILPKRETGGFPSVAMHPRNRMFYCPDCHTDFDNKGSDHVSKMRSLPIMRQRYLEFKDCLTIAEQQRVPDYLK